MNLGNKADSGEILLARVENLEGIGKTELGTTSHDERGPNTVVQGRCTEAVSHASALLDSAHISTGDSANVDTRVNEGVGDAIGNSTGDNLGSGEGSELGLLVALGEQLLGVVLESQVECSSWDVIECR
jgi:hypothetical protein